MRKSSLFSTKDFIGFTLAYGLMAFVFFGSLQLFDIGRQYGIIELLFKSIISGPSLIFILWVVDKIINSSKVRK